MDDSRFDELARSLAAPTRRRAAIRLLAGGLLSGVLAQHGRAAALAQRADRDGDGLFDDDETDVYGTNPDVFDTDGDGAGDGEEIYNRDQGLGGPSDPLTPAGGAVPPPAPTCAGLGEACAGAGGVGLGCCGADAGSGILCCFDANGAGTCTDVTGNGFLCPDPGVPATGCPIGQTNCGGFCTDLSLDHGNCGACGNRCSQVGPGYNCVFGTCTQSCAAGLTSCNGVCVDLQNDALNCGRCGHVCGPHEGTVPPCKYGACSLPF